MIARVQEEQIVFDFARAQSVAVEAHKSYRTITDLDRDIEDAKAVLEEIKDAEGITDLSEQRKARISILTEDDDALEEIVERLKAARKAVRETTAYTHLKRLRQARKDVAEDYDADVRRLCAGLANSAK